MRIRYSFIAAILAALLLFVSAGCTNTNDSTDPAGNHTDETVQTESPTVSDPMESPSVSTEPETGYSVGDIMPDFSVPLVGGGTFTLSEHRGKPVFINLFATWCPPCVGEMPDINKLYGEYGDQVAFIIIDIDPSEDESTVKNFRDSNGYSLPFTYSDTRDPFGFIQSIPDTFVLDADGVIVAFYEGGRNYTTFKGAIDTALGQ